MKKVLLTLMVAIMATSQLFAVEAMVNGINYKFQNGSFNVEVVALSSGSYRDSIVIPSSIRYNSFTYSVTSIGYRAFAGSNALTSVSIPNSVKNIGSQAFADCSYLKSVIIGNGVTNINNQTFANCERLSSVTFGNSITSIGDSAFYDCALSSIVLPASLTSIGEYAFYSNHITSMTCYGTIPPTIKQTSFSIYYKTIGLALVTGFWDIQLYVPCEAAAAYGDYDNFGGYCVTLPYTINSKCYPVFSIRPIPGDCGGQCGDNLYWSVINDTLIITGTGAMYDYDDENNIIPWYGFTLKSVSLPEEMTSIGNYAFYSCTSLTSVNIPSSVTSIGDAAFWYCSGLTSISIPNSVTSIGQSAFAYCSDLTSISIPNSVTSIGQSAFYDCTKLQSIRISDSVTMIASSTFYNCSSLTSITIPNSVTSIGDYAFYDCTKLQSVRISDSVTMIASYTFYNCSALRSVTIPNSVTSIEYCAFYNCTSLTSITCEAITPPTCGNNNSFTNIKTAIPVYVPCTSLAAYQAAEGWSAFTNIQPIDGTCPIVSPCGDSLYWSIENDTLYITGTGDMYDYNDSNNKAPWRGVTLTSVLLPEGMTSIGNYAFKGCSGLTSVTIPNSVTSIGEGAFEGCTNLTSITCEAQIPPTCGSWCFSNVSSSVLIYVPCESLRDYQHTYGWWNFGSDDYRIIPGTGCSGQCGDNLYWELLNDTLSITGTGDMYNYDFMNNPAPWYGWPFSSISLAEGVTGIGDRAFGGTKITTVSIPSSVTYIGNEAFSSCRSLTSIVIPNSVTNIGFYAFYNCTSLASITCEATTPPTAYSDPFYGVSTSIPVYVPCDAVSAYQAAKGWSMFTNIQPIDGTCLQMCGDSLYWSLNNGVLTITGTGAMYDYQEFANPSPWYGSTISTLSLPDGLTHIGDYAFLDCSGLTAVTIPNSVTSLGEYAFGYCTNLQSIVIPTSITSLGNRVFSGCSGLTSVTLPNSLTSIGDGTFAGCQALTSISIPGGVTSIGAYAFTACSDLTSITCKAMIPPTCGTDCFASVSTSIPVYVPCISVSAYQTAEGWSDFTNIQPIEGSCEAEEITDLVEEVVVEPAANTVTITWPNVSSANTYILEITKEGELICRLTFNSMGQIIDIAFAPSRNGVLPARAAQEVIGGWQFTITGLESGTHYDYALTIMNGQQPIATHTGSFITDTTNNLESQSESSTVTTMFLRDGQILIQRGNTTYNLRGQVVK